MDFWLIVKSFETWCANVNRLLLQINILIFFFTIAAGEEENVV